ncbi:hypothetical protein D3C80_1080530 [compost metagenome]
MPVRSGAVQLGACYCPGWHQFLHPGQVQYSNMLSRTGTLHICSCTRQLVFSCLTFQSGEHLSGMHMSTKINQAADNTTIKPKSQKRFIVCIYLSCSDGYRSGGQVVNNDISHGSGRHGFIHCFVSTSAQKEDETSHDQERN